MSGYLDLPSISGNDYERVSYGQIEFDTHSGYTENTTERRAPDTGQTIHEHDEIRDDHHKTLFQDIQKAFTTVSPLQSLDFGNEIVLESVNQHKYAVLSQASYDHFNGENVEKGLTNSKYSYIDDLSGFKLDPELSSTNNAVLHNAQTGETCISFRGTTDNPKRVNEFVNDWKFNAETAFHPNKATSAVRYKEAVADTEKVIAKYGKNNLTLAGHSAGGGLSSSLGQTYDLESHSFNPAISMRQTNLNHAMETATETSQNVYKTHLDFASPLGFDRDIQKNFNVELVNLNPAVKDTPIVGVHSLEQFTPEIESVSQGMVEVERNTLSSSIKNSVGSTINAGMTAYQIGTDIERDLKEGDAIDKGGAIVADVGKDVEESIADDAIMTTGLALAPETMGLSVVVGLGAVVIHNMVADKVFKQAGKGISSVAHEVRDGFEEAGHDLKKAGREIKHGFNKVGHKVSHFFHKLF